MDDLIQTVCEAVGYKDRIVNGHDSTILILAFMQFAVCAILYQTIYSVVIFSRMECHKQKRIKSALDIFLELSGGVMMLTLLVFTAYVFISDAINLFF